MKHIYILVIIICLFPNISDAQSKVGIKGGVNFSSLSGEFYGVDPKSKIGPTFGLFGDLAAYKFIHFQGELLYSAKGARFVSSDPHSSTGGKNLHINYIDIPILIKVYVEEKVFFYAGPQYSFLLKATQKTNSIKKDAKEAYQSNDFSLVYGTGFDFSSNFDLSFRINHGRKNINAKDISHQYYHTMPERKNFVLQLILGYSFK